MSGIALAVILNLTSFGLAVVGLLALLILVSRFHRAPTRSCHQCGARVPLALRACRSCGYVFSPVRFSR